MASDSTFQIGDVVYQMQRLSVFEQMHLAAEFRDGLLTLATLKKNRTKAVTDEAYAKTIEYVITGGGSVIAPEVLDRVLLRCLKTVTRRAPNQQGWVGVMTPEGVLAFQDMNLPMMIQIMYHVFEYNRLLDFFSESPSSSGGQTDESGQPFPMGKTG